MAMVKDAAATVIASGDLVNVIVVPPRVIVIRQSAICFIATQDFLTVAIIAALSHPYKFYAIFFIEKNTLTINKLQKTYEEKSSYVKKKQHLV